MFDISRLGRDFVLHLRRSHYIRFCSVTIGTLRLRGETTRHERSLFEEALLLSTHRSFESRYVLNFYTFCKFKINLKSSQRKYFLVVVKFFYRLETKIITRNCKMHCFDRLNL